jgi:cell division protein FtsB
MLCRKAPDYYKFKQGAVVPARKEVNMKRIHRKRMLIISLAAFLLLNPIHVSAALLKKGSSNNEVRQVQKVLKQLGFFQYPKITGFYGTITVKAVDRKSTRLNSSHT